MLIDQFMSVHHLAAQAMISRGQDADPTHSPHGMQGLELVEAFSQWHWQSNWDFDGFRAQSPGDFGPDFWKKTGVHSHGVSP